MIKKRIPRENNAHIPGLPNNDNKQEIGKKNNEINARIRKIKRIQVNNVILTRIQELTGKKKKKEN